MESNALLLFLEDKHTNTIIVSKYLGGGGGWGGGSRTSLNKLKTTIQITITASKSYYFLLSTFLSLKIIKQCNDCKQILFFPFLHFFNTSFRDYTQAWLQVVVYWFLTHFIPQMRISRFEHDVASARKRETLVLDQYFRFCVLSVAVTASS